MRILLINDYLEKFGGTEILTYELFNKLRERGHQVKLIGETSGQDFKSFFLRIYNPKWYKRTRSEIKQFKPNIVHVQNCSRVLSTSTISASLDSNVPVVMTIHDSNYLNHFKFTFNLYKLAKYLKIIIHRGVINRSKIYLVAPSQLFKDKISKVFYNKIKTIPNGVFIPLKTTNYSKEILFVGRLSREKGLQTISNNLNQIKEYKIIVLGEGPLKKELENKYKNINFLGFQNPNNYYKNSSILVYPTLAEESFGLSIAEAMSYGLCVITSKKGATSELVKHMETGLLFEPGNEKDFQEKLDYLLKNPSEIKRMGKNAREFVKKNFDWNKVIKQYEHLYKEVIKDQKIK